jgi:Protein of unknown function (DUF1168)
MGRFSSVQAFADNHNDVRKVPYEQVSAAGASSRDSDGGSNNKIASLVPPEKVVNPYGSTAGAGSGDFHVYRHARNRELQRQKFMEMSATEQDMDLAYQLELENNRTWEEDRTAKRRKKRERQKNAKKRKENLVKVGVIMHGGDGVASTDDHSDDEEFQYTPGEALLLAKPEDPKKMDDATSASAVEEIRNDGSFLELMKKKLQEQNNDVLP